MFATVCLLFKIIETLFPAKAVLLLVNVAVNLEVSPYMIVTSFNTSLVSGLNSS